MNADDRIKKAIPTADEEDAKAKTARHVLDLARGAISEYTEVKDAQLGGSYAKGTWLAGETDIDVFVRFDDGVPDGRFRSLSRLIGLESMAGYEPAERYADHPYVEARVDGTVVNVVPCYDVEPGRWKSAADRSPYHTRFMRENLDGRLKNDVRLLKKFLKVRGLYGAQIAVGGFSGYAAEVMIWHFGGFAETMRGMADIKRGAAIGKTARNFDTPVPIIDPIDENRNLAAAVSNRNMGLFILACRKIADNPGADPLKGQSAPPSLGWENVASVRFGRGDENPEVIWGQARSAASAVIRQMERGGFVVIRHKVLVDERQVCLLFLTESLRIPVHVVRAGPDVFRRDESVKFAGREGMVWLSPDMRLMRMERREYHTAGALLRHMLRDPGRAGIPAGLHPHIKRGASVTVGGRIAQSIKEEAAGLVRADAAVFSSAACDEG